jgi:hypothetical protein
MTAAELYERAKYFFPPPPLPEFSIDDAFQATGGSGVYFLYRDDVLVYVGESLCVRTRLLNHPHRRHVNRCSVIECDKSQRKRLEAFYIGVLNPRWNRESSDCVDSSDASAKKTKHCKASLCRKIYSVIKERPGCSLSECRKAAGWRHGSKNARRAIDVLVEWGFVSEVLVQTPGRVKRVYFLQPKGIT